jgi:excisionase family DNA binding protein
METFKKAVRRNVGRVDKLFSTAELARMWNISESTVKRWADAGELACVKTPGGHRRFTLEEVSRFQRAQGFEAVGRLVTAAGDDDDAPAPDLERALERPDFGALATIFIRSAVGGDVASVSALLARAYLRGVQPVDLHERIIASALHTIGEMWTSGELTVADEHLATRTILDALVRLQPELLRRATNGKTAVVGCPEDEMHEVAARCAAFLLELDGWRVILLGMDTPFFSFKDAVGRHKPALVVVSSTILVDLDRQSRDYAPLYEAAASAGARVLIGGAGFRDPAVRARFPHDAYATTFRDLLRYASGV